MPRIPTLSGNQVSPQPLPTVRREYLRDTRGESLGEGLQVAGNVVSKIQAQEQLKADRAAFMEADRTTDEISNDIYNRASSKRLKDAIGVGPEALDEFDKKSADILNGLQTPRQKRVYQESLNQQRANLRRSLDSHERQETERYYAEERKAYADQARQNAVTYYQDPSRIEQEIAKQGDVVNQTPGLSDAMKADAIAKLRAGTYSDVIDRYLANEQVAGAEKYYASVKSRVGGDAATHIENSIRITKDRLENRAQALQNKREAAALRAVNQTDQQIAAGLPVSSQSWKALEVVVKGTEMESEFKDMQKNEADVQDVLRKPIQEQVKFLQDKEAALKSGGGSVRDLANYNRLKTAITQNVKLLSEAPLQFNAVRTGLEVEPLDIAALAGGDGSQIADRINTLTGMRKQYGDVPLKTLLPQEAAQLSAALQKASPRQQSEVFGGLYKAMGPDAYKVAMQQIAPDSPVRALAGMIAGKQAELTTKTHWFKSDEIVGSGDVSATLLQGEDMLNATKTDKKQDGKPNVSLYLPETKTLQDSFQNRTGAAFAGRPAAAETAFQAVKAYYVGRAAQIGRLAADKSDIDGDLVEESITATLGTVVDFNGQGEVFAPWGMDESAFKDKAETALVSEAKRRGLNDSQIKALSNAGLKNAGDGVYYVTQGKNYVVDKQNAPIVIRVE